MIYLVAVLVVLILCLIAALWHCRQQLHEANNLAAFWKAMAENDEPDP